MKGAKLKEFCVGTFGVLPPPVMSAVTPTLYLTWPLNRVDEYAVMKTIAII
jgi:hypothetical protein